MENRRFKTEMAGHLPISSLLAEKEILSKYKVKKEWWWKQKWGHCAERKYEGGKKKNNSLHAYLKLIFAVCCSKLLHFLMQIIVFFVAKRMGEEPCSVITVY